MQYKLLVVLLFASYSFLQASFTPIAIPTRVTDESKKYLAADLYTTDTSKPKPTILIQTPYNKDKYHQQSTNTNLDGGTNIFMDSLFYNYVIVDWRGFYGSTNADIVGYDRGLDGFDIVEWIASQKWSNGKIGTYGGSALGQIQFLTAKEQPPHLICAVPMIKDFKTKYSDYFYGGDYRKEHVQSLVKLGFITEQILLAHPAQDNFWNLVEKNTNYPDKIEIPMLLITGWFDHFPSEVIRCFEDLQKFSSNKIKAEHKLIIGPWLHTALGDTKQGIWEFPEAAGIPASAARRFFDYYLRNIYNGWPAEPVVKYFEMGSNLWRTSKSWSDIPRTSDTLYFNDQMLSSSISEQNKSDDLVFDPRDPSPTVGGSRFDPFKAILMGPQDQTKLVESRNDVLIKSTEVLKEDYSINGKVTCELFVSCNREDTDFSFRLCDVQPDGKSVLLSQGIRRARFRNSYWPAELMKPDSIYLIKIDLCDLCHVFKTGHKLRAIISNSDYPMFDVNINNGKGLYIIGDTLIANSKIYQDNNYPSRLIIPKPDINEDKFESAEDIKQILYPNPANCIINIKLEDMYVSDIRVTLLDLLGRDLQSFQFQNQGIGTFQQSINISMLEPGIYFLKVNNGKIIYNLKFHKY